MKPTPRIVLAIASVAIIGVVAFTAAELGPRDARLGLQCCGVIALVAAVQSATSDPADIVWALLFGLAPVVGLIAEASPTWLVGPLATALLVASELNALGWECQGARSTRAAIRRRLLHIGQLAVLGLAASLALSAIAA